MKRNFVQVLNSGSFTTIQDLGRKGFLAYGIPQGGALISRFSKLVNDILENEQDCALIETFGVGLKVRFSASAQIAVAGKNLTVLIDNEAIIIEDGVTCLWVFEGSVLHIAQNQSCIYIGIKGGWQTEVAYSSRSFLSGITQYSRLERFQLIPFLPQSRTSSVTLSNTLKQQPDFELNLRVAPGPEFIKSSNASFKFSLSISKDSNRHAISFEETIEGDFKEIPTSYCPTGTIQVTPSGKVYVLSKDAQTTGGYYRLGFVSLDDLEKLHGLNAGSKVTFEVAQ